MNAFKRISIALNAQISSMIDQIEDHEALANAALADIRDSLLRTKFQVKRIQNEQRAFEQRLEELGREEQDWKKRALASRDQEQDKERALECVRRLAKAQEEAKTVASQLTEHRKIEAQLSEDVRKIEMKFEELKRKKNTLAARESRSEALKKVAHYQACGEDMSVLDRWENKILKSEVESGGFEEAPDEFAKQFTDEEEKRKLEALLDGLATDEA